MFTRGLALWAVAVAAATAEAGPAAVLLDDVPDNADLTHGTLRALVAVPSNATGDSRLRRRGEKIREAVSAHVATANANQGETDQTIVFAFMEEDHPEFAKTFPLHVPNSKLDEPLPFPGLKLVNLASGDFMSPDWHITTQEWPDELNRLVRDFRRWVQQDDSVTVDADGVMMLHANNIGQSLLEHDQLLVNFYAPWCKYSQAMLPRVAEANRVMKSLSDAGLLDVRVGVGKVNLDEESVLKARHEISSYPTLKMVSASAALDEPEKSVPFGGFSESASQIVSHLAAAAEPFRDLEDESDALKLVRLLAQVDAAAKADGSADRAVLVMSTFNSPTALNAVANVARATTGRGSFVAMAEDLEVAKAAVDGRCQELGLSAPPAVEADSVVVVSQHGVLVAPPSWANKDLGASKDAEARLLQWVSAASFPTVDKFDSSAVQGERVRSGPISSVMVLVADEDDFMFADFLGALEDTAEARRGDAVFLWADDDEPRVAPMLRRAGVSEAPAVVLMSMRGLFPVASVTGRDITPAGLSSMLEQAFAFEPDAKDAKSDL